MGEKNMEKPRERAKNHGVDVLSDTELLAILLRTGRNGKDVMSVAKELMEIFDNSFLRMEKASIEELLQIPGIGMAKSLTIQAALEVGKRMWKESLKGKRRLMSAADIFEMCKDMTLSRVEKVRIMAVDAKLNLIASKNLSSGTATSSLVHPREVFAFAVSYPTSGIFLIHNHPSGDPHPSEEDIKITERIEKASEIMGISLLDHVIVASQGYYSFSEKKVRLQKTKLATDI